MNQRVTPLTGRTKRQGFTLIEMLLVIVIIGILAALLLPAIQAARTTAQNTAVRSEISALEAAIANFKAAHGIEPPSGIIICETPGDWASFPASREAIRKMWPNFDFSLSRDFDRDGASSKYFALRHTEALIFFLGGINSFTQAPTVDFSKEAPMGFSKNPANPFANPAPGEVREGPYFEFNPSRIYLRDSATNFVKLYKDSLPGQTLPYLYFNSYEGRQYGLGIDLLPGRAGQDDDGNSVTDKTMSGAFDLPEVGFQNAGAGYFTDDELPPNATFAVYLTAVGGSPHKPKAFQIISPGADADYGSGGYFDPTKTNGGLANKADADNVTNLAAGKLVP